MLGGAGKADGLGADSGWAGLQAGKKGTTWVPDEGHVQPRRRLGGLSPQRAWVTLEEAPAQACTKGRLLSASTQHVGSQAGLREG